jgi:hypothetical protein
LKEYRARNKKKHAELKMQEYPRWGKVYGFGLRCAKKGKRVREIQDTDYMAFFAGDTCKVAYIPITELGNKQGKVIQGVYIKPGMRPTKTRYDSKGRRLHNDKGRYFEEYSKFKV